MERDEAEELGGLLAYPEDTAGGMMTTEFVAVPADLTAGATIERLRELEPDAETIYYVYVVDGDGPPRRRAVAARPHRRAADRRRSARS